MAEKTTYELKGTLRSDCMKDSATLEGFRALESDWRELFRWLMSVSGDLPLRDAEGKAAGRLSELWKDHVLVVLVEVVCKDLDSYVTSFVGGQGTSGQKRYTAKLTNRCMDWTLRLDRFVKLSHGYSPDSPAMQVAVEIKEQLASALPSAGIDNMQWSSSFMDNRNQPYYRMLGALEDIQGKAEEYIARIESGGDMDASLALLLTMIRNYCGIASAFNGRFCGLAEFYRREILRDRAKGAVQDSTYITIEPDRSKAAATFSLPKGTKFPAGQTGCGDQLYGLDEKAYIVPAVLCSAQAVFSRNDRLYSASLLSEENRSVRLFPEEGMVSAEWEYGWIVASRSLVLSQGQRQVCVGFAFAMDDGSAVPDLSGTFNGDGSSFDLYVSGEEGWLPLCYGLEYDTAAVRLDFTFSLGEDDPAPVPCGKELHGLCTDYPAVRILFADRHHIDTLPEGLCIGGIRIRTVVDGMHGFTLKGDLGDMDPGQPFYPFGPLGERGGTLVFGHAEAAVKNTVKVWLKGVWIRLPEQGFREIYRHYGTRTPLDKGSFKARCEWHDGNRWQACKESEAALFTLTGGGDVCERAAIELDLGGTPGYSPEHNRKGQYRITLVSPDIGFGMNAYYRLYAAAMMHNSREKQKKHIPVPQIPQVPMLADAVFGYESEEFFSPGDACGSHLFRVSEATGCEECAVGAPLVFVPRTSVPSLILGFTELGDTVRLRLYFNLRYIMTGERNPAPAGCGKGRMVLSYHAPGRGWMEFAQEDILCEQTDGLTRSGFIEVRCPVHGNDGWVWLMLGFPDGDAPTGTAVEGIWSNCFRVTAENGDGMPLPAGTIAAPYTEDRRIRRFFCGWLPDGTLPDLGMRFSHEALRSRVANDECVAKAILLTVDGAEAEVLPDGGDTLYRASCMEGVLYVRDIRIELVDGPSGVEEARIGGDFTIG